MRNKHKEIKNKLWEMAGKDGGIPETFNVEIKGYSIRVSRVAVDRPQGVFSFEYYIDGEIVSRAGDTSKIEEFIYRNGFYLKDLNINYWASKERKLLNYLISKFHSNWPKIQEITAKKNKKNNENYSWRYWFGLDGVGTYSYLTDAELAILLYEYTRDNLEDEDYLGVNFVLNFKEENNA